MQLLVRRAICNVLTDSHLFLKFIILFLFFVSNTPLRIMHARISNNLNKEFIMMTNITIIHVQRQRSFVFKD